ncbi:MAG: protein kinase, partial [Planctomycetes bacterium]|nr:protein kinase [Planctomycetota bacterium]
MADPLVVACPKCGSEYDMSAYPQGYSFDCPKCGSPVEYRPAGGGAPPPAVEPGLGSEIVIIEDEEEALKAAAGDGEEAGGEAAAESPMDVEATLGPASGGAAAGPTAAAEPAPKAAPPGGKEAGAGRPGGKGPSAPEAGLQTASKKKMKEAAAQGEATMAEPGTGGVPSTMLSKTVAGGASLGTAAGASRFTAMEEFKKNKEEAAAPGKKAKKFGDFRVIRELGRGAMGVVYEAIQEPIGRRVALKMMLPSFTSNPEAVERFLRESKNTAKLQHPNIVPVYGMGEQDGTYYYAMGFIQGVSLKDALKDDVAPHKERVSILRDATRALDYAHVQGIIHRDIKPANIMITKDDKKVLLTDFGIAKSEEQSTMTADGQVLGTPMYMSPEQAQGSSAEVDRRSDVYSMGATMYETITLARPFHGEDVRSIIRNVIETDPLPPRRIDPKIPKDLETICLKAMEKNPVKRYDTAGAMADDLDRWLKGEPIAARPIGLFARVGRKVRKNKMATALILLLMLVLAGGAAGGAWWWMDRQTRIREGLENASALFAEGEKDPEKYLEAKDAYAKVQAIDQANAAAREGLEKCDLMIKDLTRKKNEATIRKKLGEAAEAFNASKFKEARNLYGGVLALDAENAAAKLGIQKCDLKLGQIEEEERRDAMRKRLETALAAASTAYKEEKYKQARDLYQGVLALDASSAAAREGMEKCDLKLVQLEEERLRKELAGKIEGILAEAEAKFKEEKYQDALKAYQRILPLDEGNAAAKVGIEKCELAIQHLKAEAEKYEKMQRADALAAEGETLLAEGVQVLGRAAEAVAKGAAKEAGPLLEASAKKVGEAGDKFSEAL